MITSLTKEQEAAIPEYIERYASYASQPIDRTRLPDIIKGIYRKEKTVIIAESPTNLMRLIALLTNGKKLKYDSQLYSQLYSQLDSQLYSQLYSQLRSQLYSQLSSQLNSQLSSQLNSQLDSQLDQLSQLRSQLYSQLYSQLSSQLDSQLDSQLNSQLYSQLYSQLRSQLDSQLSSQLYSQLYSQLDIPYAIYVSYFWYEWCAYYEYGDFIGAAMDKEKLSQFKDIILNMPIVVFIGDIIFVVEKPICSWDERGMLHKANGPAIKWADGTGYYTLHGVSFPEKLFKKVTDEDNPPSAKDILAIEDIDQRTQAMRFLPPEEMVKQLNGVLLDEVQKIAADGSLISWKLYQFPKGDTFEVDAYYCLMDCPSTGKKHIEGVFDFGNPPENKTVPEAMAWAQSNEFVTVTPEDWQRMVPLTHEN